MTRKIVKTSFNNLWVSLLVNELNQGWFEEPKLDANSDFQLQVHLLSDCVPSNSPFKF